MSANTSRLAAFERQIDRVQQRRDTIFQRRNVLIRWQITIMIAGIFATTTTLAIARWLGILVGLACLIGIFVIGHFQYRLDRRLPLYGKLADLLEVQLARLRLDWAALPAVPVREEGTDHPFDTDLDITGERSLLRLLHVGVTRGGRERLQQWLLSRTPDLDAIRRRQQLARELTPMTRFRNRLLIYSLFATSIGSEELEADTLVTWLRAQNASQARQRFSTLLIALVLSALLYLSVILYGFFQISPLFCVGAVFLSLIWFMSTSKEQGNLAEDTFSIRMILTRLHEVFAFLETYSYPRRGELRNLCEPFFGHSDRNPSLLLKRLRSITTWASMASQAGVWIGINVLFPVGAVTAYRLDRCKEQLLHYLPTWLDTWYELEALSSLANFAYLNPEYTLPEFVTAKGQSEQPIHFQAQGLGHPLLNKDKKVMNDLTVEKAGTIILITGSNMAGKSTFLRTIGINLCLAYAGGVVNAVRLRTSLFEIYGCIRVTDSLADGYSYFYAEVRRLKGLLTELEQGSALPVFFLIDEIFKGTNNYERLVGSEAYIRALAGNRCVGAISTHDLELVKLADALPGIVNMHFREEVVEGQMVFDYALHDGPCPTRNALRIMELEGLPVRWDASAVSHS